MQKTGAVEKTNDVEFAEEERSIREAEKRVGRMQKESKACLDAMRVLSASKIIEDLNYMGLELSSMPRYKEMCKIIEELTVSEIVPDAWLTCRIRPSVRWSCSPLYV
jgi:hypothetical protein